MEVTDIVERLGGWVERFERTTPLEKAMLLEARDEIKRLRAEIESMRVAEAYARAALLEPKTWR